MANKRTDEQWTEMVGRLSLLAFALGVAIGFAVATIASVIHGRM